MGIVVFFCAAFSYAAGEEVLLENAAAPQAVTAMLTVLRNGEMQKTEAKLWFFETDPYTPYVDVSLLLSLYPGKSYAFSEEELTCAGQSGSVLFDAEKNVLIWRGLSLGAPFVDEALLPGMFEYTCREEEGEERLISLSPYRYVLHRDAQKLLCPLTVLSALFAEPEDETLFFYGTDLFCCSIIDILGEEEDRVTFEEEIMPVLRSRLAAWEDDPQKALANYRALCFRFDYCFGLELWQQETFDAFLSQNYPQTKAALLSGEKEKMLSALSYDFTFPVLQDSHTGLIALVHEQEAQSISVLPNVSIERYVNSRSNQMLLKLEKLGALRASAFPEEVNPEQFLRFYKDMAVITFDEFMVRFSARQVGENNIDDTISFMEDCLRQIQNKGGIRSIVLDITQNTGGFTEALAAVLSMMQNPFQSVIVNRLTGAVRTETVSCAQMAEKVREDYGFYILTSPCSFSCGNLLPSIAKSMHAASIVGQPGGGGSCSVYVYMDLYGNAFGYSGGWASYTMNDEGNLASVETGAEVDIAMEESAWYNDEALYCAIQKEK